MDRNPFEAAGWSKSESVVELYSDARQRVPAAKARGLIEVKRLLCFASGSCVNEADSRTPSPGSHSIPGHRYSAYIYAEFPGFYNPRPAGAQPKNHCSGVLQNLKKPIGEIDERFRLVAQTPSQKTETITNFLSHRTSPRYSKCKAFQFQSLVNIIPIAKLSCGIFFHAGLWLPGRITG